MSFWGALGSTLAGGPLGLGLYEGSQQPGGLSGSIGSLFGVGAGDPGNPYRTSLNANGQQQGAFGQQLQAGMLGTMGGLQALANGQDSVGQEQLRQGLQQQQAAQMSMAAGAAPQNQVMAQRNAATNMAREGYGMAGQAAMQSMQERQNALNTLAQMQTQGALGMGGLSNGAYGTELGDPQKTWGSLIGGAIGGGAGAAAKFG